MPARPRGGDGGLRHALSQVLAHRELTAEEARSALEAILDGEVPASLLAAFLVSLRMRGESVTELASFARVMRGRARRIRTDHAVVVDTCGTGGDGAGTFNVSTVVAFVVAAAGVPVAKHGNRSVSSRCGSADLLEGLGIRIDGPPEDAEAGLRDAGLGFLYAPTLHPLLGRASAVRRELGVRTVFNLLGPLANPAGAPRQLIGVYDGGWVEKVAHVLLELGSERAMVVHGGGLDEIALHDETIVAELRDGRVRMSTLCPEDAGLPRAALHEIAGGDSATNVAIAGDVLNGTRGPRRDIVLLNAAAALMVAGRTDDLRQAVAVAADAIDSGAARAVVQRLRALAPYAGRRG
ncbi:MAG TPA: anthranilate phosphoribosyltransferase [Candidatus Polarisedimenticolia bacterium]|nr:anthranilate phosphoribosyltransferase [Candidatus Polarisedimenticolia bacterium]